MAQYLDMLPHHQGYLPKPNSYTTAKNLYDIMNQIRFEHARLHNVFGFGGAQDILVPELHLPSPITNNPEPSDRCGFTDA